MSPARILRKPFLFFLAILLTAFVFTACGKKAESGGAPDGKSAKSSDGDTDVDVGYPLVNTKDYTKEKGGEELRKGKAAYNIGKYDEAAMSFSLAVEDGNAEAMYRLGKCFLDGTGVERNVEKAVLHFRKAEKAGYFIDPQTQYEVGQRFFNGEEIKTDETEAARWYRKAAEQGHAKAQIALGKCYQDGKGVEQDRDKAVKWFRTAAEQGHAEAQFRLGKCYRDGKGVEQDRDKAVKWFRMAAKQDHPEALSALITPLENEIDELNRSLKTARAGKAMIEKLKYQNIAAKDAYWNVDRDGQPETELRNLVNDAAVCVEANLQNLGSVRMSTINPELSYALLEFTVVDEYDKVIRLIAEIEKCKPRLYWVSADIRVENSRARNVASANRQNSSTTTTTPPQIFRATMRVRVIRYSPGGNASDATRTASAAKTGASAPASAPASTEPAATISAATSSTATQPASADTPVKKERAETGNDPQKAAANQNMTNAPRITTTTVAPGGLDPGSFGGGFGPGMDFGGMPKNIIFFL